jgi:THO complex subunit 7
VNISEKEHDALRDQIDELKVALEHAHMERKRKVEYDLISEKINTLPSREELEQCVMLVVQATLMHSHWI